LVAIVVKQFCSQLFEHEYDLSLALRIVAIARSFLLGLLIVAEVGNKNVAALPVNTVSVTVESPSTKLSHPRLWVVSGGQTGVDRAALDTAMSLYLPVRGWCPKGRLAEDGTISSIYPLQETPGTEYAVRTEWNVRDSDGTIILAYGELAGGTKLTAELAHKYKRPVLVLDAITFSQDDIAHFHQWIQQNHIRILNVAGPRESAKPGTIYKRARNILQQLLG